MRKRRRAGEGQEKRKSENRRPILKKLCAALLQSFRGQHSKKMKGSARGNWDPWEGQQPFRPNPNRAGDRTTTLQWLLIGADEFKLGNNAAQTTANINKACVESTSERTVQKWFQKCCGGDESFKDEDTTGLPPIL